MSELTVGRNNSQAANHDARAAPSPKGRGVEDGTGNVPQSYDPDLVYVGRLSYSDASYTEKMCGRPCFRQALV